MKYIVRRASQWNDEVKPCEEAKQEKTKIARMEKIKPMIFAGQGLHDKYKK